MEKPMSSSVKVSSFITYGSWRPKNTGNAAIRDTKLSFELIPLAHRNIFFFHLLHCRPVFVQASTSTNPDLTELHLDLF